MHQYVNKFIHMMLTPCHSTAHLKYRRCILCVHTFYLYLPAQHSSTHPAEHAEDAQACGWGYKSPRSASPGTLLRVIRLLQTSLPRSRSAGENRERERDSSAHTRIQALGHAYTYRLLTACMLHPFFIGILKCRYSD